MNAATLKALHESQAHWKRLMKWRPGQCVGLGPAECALCQMFIGTGCVGCPIKVRTGRTYCQQTPHEAAVDAKHAFGIDSPQFRAAARKEYEFLMSLEPKRKVKR